tara:strand:+ start:1272 stop:1517 length:246 start_codon:yes stop_codon:yes gene_type:complete
MYSNVAEDNLKAKDLVKIKGEIKLSMDKIHKEIDLLNSEISKLGRKLAKINLELKKVCQHEWTRESVPYSDLYCNKCGVWK